MTPTTMRTRSGAELDLLNLDPSQIRLTDIAWSLSMQCRFNGHVNRFYSVAQHSLLVAEFARPLAGRLSDPLVHQELERAALMHDAAEAYIGDIISPLKTAMRSTAVLGISDLDLLERDLDLAIRMRYSLHSFRAMKQIDLEALALEMWFLTDAPRSDMPQFPAPAQAYNIVNQPMSPREAYEAFLAVAERLGIRDPG